MTRRATSTALVLVLVAAPLAACTGSSSPTGSHAGSASAGPGAASSTGSSSASTAAPASGACANPYQPVAEGDAWSYSLSGTGGGASYTDTITSVGGSSFTMTSEFENLTRETKWSCTEDGLIALTFGGGVSGSLTAQDLSATFRTTDVKGVTVPAAIEPGETWQQSYGIRGTISVGNAKAKASGTVRYDFEAGDTVGVEVAAGSFDAIAVDTAIELDLRAAVAGVETPVDLTFGGTTYLVRDVGVVRATSDASMFGESMRSTIELTEYSLG